MSSLYETINDTSKVLKLSSDLTISEFKIGRREPELHRMFRFKVAVAAILMLKLR